MKDWTLLHTLEAGVEIRDIAIHSSGKLLFLIGKHQKFAVWDLTKCKKLIHQKLKKGILYKLDCEKIKLS